MTFIKKIEAWLQKKQDAASENRYKNPFVKKGEGSIVYSICPYCGHDAAKYKKLNYRCRKCNQIYRK